MITTCSLVWSALFPPSHTHRSVPTLSSQLIGCIPAWSDPVNSRLNRASAFSLAVSEPHAQSNRYILLSPNFFPRLFPSPSPLSSIRSSPLCRIQSFVVFHKDVFNRTKTFHGFLFSFLTLSPLFPLSHGFAPVHGLHPHIVNSYCVCFYTKRGREE